MTNAFLLFRSLVIYGLCLPLAIFIGYLLATPTDMTSMASVSVLLSLMTIPLFLRWHYPWLVFSWNLIAGLFFLPGKPSFALAMSFISFGISMLAYIMNRNLKFLPAPSITRPLLVLGAVVVATAKLTGGIGLNVLGSDTMGGKRYIVFLSAIIGYFALTAQRIPLRKAALYVNLFFMGGISAAIGDLFSVLGPGFSFIFLVFAPDIALGAGDSLEGGVGIARFTGLAVASGAGIAMLLARYGLEGLLDVRKYWRFLLFMLLVVGILFGGFRSRLIDLAVTIAILFYFEGLFKSRLLPGLLLACVLGLAFVIPFANKMPLSVQRSLTFLPLNLDPEVIQNAKGSTDWRLEIWANVLPMVPQYLILGKGLGIDPHDFDMSTHGMTRGSDIGSGATLAGDYHSGPLSLIIQFGLPGVLAFLWFLGAGIRGLYRNYQYGDPALRRINRFLLTVFLAKMFSFFIVVGSFYSDMAFFCGYIGLSVALNGGIRGPVVEPEQRQVFNRFKLATAAR